jgi:hypothetical protein
VRFFRERQKKAAARLKVAGPVDQAFAPPVTLADFVAQTLVEDASHNRNYPR